MAYTTVDYSPYNLLKEQSELTSYEPLTNAQFSRLKKLFQENAKDELITTIIPNLDNKDVKLFSKPLLKQIPVEAMKLFKSINDKTFEKKINLETIQAQLLPHKIDINAPHFVIAEPHLPIIYSEVYQGIVNAIDDFDTKASDEKFIEKVQQMVALILIIFTAKNFTSSYVWSTKIAKIITLISYDEAIIQSALDLLPPPPMSAVASEDAVGTPKRSRRRKSTASTAPIVMSQEEFYPHFKSFFNDNILTQIATNLAGSVNTIAIEVGKNIQREYKKLNQQKKDEEENIAIAAKEKDTSMSDKTTTTTTTNEKTPKSTLPTLEVAQPKHHVQYVDATHVWDPTFEDQLFAINNLRIGQVRFGVVQGIEDNLGIFVETYQNHVKVRCLCPITSIYDYKTLRTKVQQFGGLKDQKTTKPMEKTINGFGGDDKRKRKEKEVEEKDEEAFVKYPKELIMKFVKKDYQIGDRISFVITDVGESTKSNKNLKQASVSKTTSLKLPKVFISFTTSHFVKLSAGFSTKMAVALKYLLYVKMIELKNRLLFGKFINFYPPRFFDQVLQTPILSHFLSEFNINDSKLLAMQFDITPPTYAEEWAKSNGLRVPKDLGKKKKKNEMNDEESEEDGDVSSSDDESTPSDQLGQLTGEFGQYSDDSDNEDQVTTKMGKADDNVNVVIKNNLRSDLLFNRFFAPNLGQISLYRNFNNQEGVGTKAFVQLHNHNGFSYSHYHCRPGVNSSLFNATSKQSRQVIINHINTREEASQIFVQSINMLRGLMSLQPYPSTSGLSLKKTALKYHFVVDSERQADVVKFFCDRERSEYLSHYGSKHHKYIIRNNKIKSKQMRAIVSILDAAKAKNDDKLAFEEVQTGGPAVDFTTLDVKLVDTISTFFNVTATLPTNEITMGDFDKKKDGDKKAVTAKTPQKATPAIVEKTPQKPAQPTPKQQQKQQPKPTMVDDDDDDLFDEEPVVTKPVATPVKQVTSTKQTTTPAKQNAAPVAKATTATTAATPAKNTKMITPPPSSTTKQAVPSPVTTPATAAAPLTAATTGEEQVSKRRRRATLREAAAAAATPEQMVQLPPPPQTEQPKAKVVESAQPVIAEPQIEVEPTKPTRRRRATAAAIMTEEEKPSVEQDAKKNTNNVKKEAVTTPPIAPVVKNEPQVKKEQQSQPPKQSQPQTQVKKEQPQQPQEQQQAPVKKEVPVKAEATTTPSTPTPVSSRRERRRSSKAPKTTMGDNEDDLFDEPAPVVVTKPVVVVPPVVTKPVVVVPPVAVAVAKPVVAAQQQEQPSTETPKLSRNQRRKQQQEKQQEVEAPVVPKQEPIAAPVVVKKEVASQEVTKKAVETPKKIAQPQAEVTEKKAAVPATPKATVVVPAQKATPTPKASEAKKTLEQVVEKVLAQQPTVALSNAKKLFSRKSIIESTPAAVAFVSTPAKAPVTAAVAPPAKAVTVATPAKQTVPVATPAKTVPVATKDVPVVTPAKAKATTTKVVSTITPVKVAPAPVVVAEVKQVKAPVVKAPVVAQVMEVKAPAFVTPAKAPLPQPQANTKKKITVVTPIVTKRKAPVAPVAIPPETTAPVAVVQKKKGAMVVPVPGKAPVHPAPKGETPRARRRSKATNTAMSDQ